MLPCAEKLPPALAETVAGESQKGEFYSSAVDAADVAVKDAAAPSRTPLGRRRRDGKRAGSSDDFR
jgi:hypothetical protein